MKQMCVAAVLAGVLVAGCGSKDETVVVGPDGQTATVSKDGKDVTIKGPNGAELHTDDNGQSMSMKNDKGDTFKMGGAVTEDQLGLPFYPGSAESPGNMVAEEKGVKSVVCSRSTKDDPDRVIAFYKDKVEGGSSTNVSSGGMKTAILSAAKLKDGSEVTITAMRENGKDTVISIGVKHSK